MFRPNNDYQTAEFINHVLLLLQWFLLVISQVVPDKLLPAPEDHSGLDL